MLGAVVAASWPCSAARGRRAPRLGAPEVDSGPEVDSVGQVLAAVGGRCSGGPCWPAGALGARGRRRPVPGDRRARRPEVDSARRAPRSAGVGQVLAVLGRPDPTGRARARPPQRWTHDIRRPRVVWQLLRLPEDARSGMDASTPGDRIREARKRRGMTQRELAEAAGLSVSAVKKIEQGTLGELRLQTARRLAVALGVPTMAIVDPSPPEPREPADRSIWAPTRDALISPQTGDAGEPLVEHNTTDVLLGAVRLYHDNAYDRLARVLPLLLRDTRDASPLLRSRVMQLAGSVMTQTRNHDAARVALTQSMVGAEATGSDLDAASTVITMCWLLLIEGQFEQVRHLAVVWADRVEPRLSTATYPEISVWGWLLLRGSAAAIRDNRPGEAADMMRLAEAAAVAAGNERGGYRQYWTTFGPATVAMKRTENALVDGRPDVALRLAARVPQGLRPTSDNRNRHLLDVSAAHAELRHYDDAVGVLKRLQAEAGPWLGEQRMARDTLGRIIHRRRTLTQDMRDLADAVRLPL